MTRTILRKSALAFAVTLGAAVVAAAQQPARSNSPPPPPGTSAVPPATGTADPNAHPQAIRAKQVLGTRVTLQNNTAAGTVEDIVLTDGGEVEYLIVTRDDGKLSTVPWSAVSFNFQQKTAVLNITPEQYKVVPTYTATSYPDFFTPTYRTETYKYYGLRPGQFRRMERRLNRP